MGNKSYAYGRGAYRYPTSHYYPHNQGERGIFLTLSGDTVGSYGRVGQRSHTSHSSSLKGDSRGDIARRVISSEEINHSSLLSFGESVDGVGRNGFRSRTNPSPSHHSVDYSRLYSFYNYGDKRSGHRSHTIQFSAYNYGAINISHPRFPQEAISRGVYVKNLHQNHPYYYYPSIPINPHPSMIPHSHHNIPPHIYPSIPPHQVFLCPYFTSTPMYAPYVVPHYSPIPPLGYINTSDSKYPYLCCLLIPKKIFNT